MKRHAALLLVAALSVPGHAKVRAMTEPTTQHAAGSFEVVMTPQAHDAEPAGGVPTSRMGLAKTFSGDLTGTATGTMLAAGSPTPGSAAAYVALDQFTGKLAGRSGGFVLIHRGTIDKAGHAELQVVVAPDTGTGELAGITGTLAIRVEGGRHLYQFDYILPPR